jgi:hypothetical protein
MILLNVNPIKFFYKKCLEMFALTKFCEFKPWLVIAEAIKNFFFTKIIWTVMYHHYTG